MTEAEGSPLPLTEDMVTRVAVVASLRRPRLRVHPKMEETAEAIVNSPTSVVERQRLTFDDELPEGEWRLNGR